MSDCAAVGGAVPTRVRVPVTLTPTGATAALAVLQQLGGAAGLGRVPLLQPQPGCLILGKGAQVLRVTPVHLGEKDRQQCQGGWCPSPGSQVGKLSHGSSGHTGMACQLRKQPLHPKAKGWRHLWECPTALQGVGRSQADKVSVDQW